MSKKHKKSSSEAVLVVKSTDKSSPESKAVKQTEQMPKKSAQPSKKQSGGGVITTLSLLIALLASGAAGYLWYDMQALQKHLATTEAKAQTTSGSLQIFQHDMAETNQMIKEQQVEMADQATSIKSLLSKEHKKPGDWVLNEVDYLLRLAILNVEYNHSVESGLSLLKTADERLTSLGGPKVSPVRRAIAKDINALKSVAIADVEGILIRLNALTTALHKLPLVPPPQLTNETATAAPKKNDKTIKIPAAWRKALTNSWKELKSLVVIRHADTPIAPLLSEEERYILDQQFLSQIAQIRWAVLQGNETLYKSSLDQISSFLKKYFTLNNKAAQALIAELKALKAMPIQTTLPDISGSLKALGKVKS